MLKNLKRKYDQMDPGVSSAAKKVAFGTDKPSVLDVVQTVSDAYTNPVGYGLKVGYRTLSNQMLRKPKRTRGLRKYVVKKGGKVGSSINTAVSSNYVRRIRNYGLQTRGPELKRLDFNATNTPVSSTGVFNATFLNGIAAGTGVNERVGRRVVMKSLHLKGMVYSANATGNFVTRMVIIYDKDNNGGSNPTATTVFTVDDFRGQINLDNADRFQIIADNWFEYSSTYDPPKHYDLYIPMDLPITYNSTTNAITSIQCGSLLMYCVTTGSNLTGDATFTFSGRVRFTDQ